ncbi:phosphate ABC transporter substrate-binding protein PstS, partial [Dolichospermum circinale CS-545/17]|nr:phosphate ABC transporter substrate-binding protein PstS [Dolichospermum circinale CS-545/17]
MLLPSGEIKNHRFAVSIFILALAIGLSACGQNSAENNKTSSSQKLDLGGNVELTGAGASFPSPLYQT